MSVAVDPNAVLSATFEPTIRTWDDRDVILYHLGIGAGRDPLDAVELRYVYEKDLKVAPSFATLIGTNGGAHRKAMGSAEGVSVLHGEHSITLPAVLQPSGTVVNHSRVVELLDKGSTGALLAVETESRTEAGSLVCRNVGGYLFRSLGGFGGPRDSGVFPRLQIPGRVPDQTVRVSTRSDQALIYRLSGDRNPLHCDPDYAKARGYERPILHGLATYGLICRTAVECLLAGDTSQVAEYRARFAGVVFPGDELQISLWFSDQWITIRAMSVSTNSPVLVGELRVR